MIGNNPRDFLYMTLGQIPMSNFFTARTDPNVTFGLRSNSLNLWRNILHRSDIWSLYAILGLIKQALGNRDQKYIVMEIYPTSEEMYFTDRTSDLYSYILCLIGQALWNGDRIYIFDAFRLILALLHIFYPILIGLRILK